MADPVLYQVNGPAVVYVSGRSTSKLALGICRDKLRIVITYYDHKIQSDNAGVSMPADVQNMGADAVIRCSLSQFAPDVLDSVSNRGKTVGMVGPIGAPMGASGMTFKLHIPSNYKPWTFWNCILKSRGDGLGTEFSTIDLEFYAYAAIGNTLDAKDVPLFTHIF